jgi:hypothetical protein
VIAKTAHAALMCLALSGLVAFGTAHASEADYLNRFAGSFSGSGQVKRNASENASQVQCTLTGQPSANGVSMSGQCGAFIFTKQIRAEIRFDPATGRYTGTYIGSSIGPARLSGKRRGDAVVLAIIWPQPVNGDTRASMTISNAGHGRLLITITDRVGPGGAMAQVTKLVLARV